MDPYLCGLTEKQAMVFGGVADDLCFNTDSKIFEVKMYKINVKNKILLWEAKWNIQVVSTQLLAVLLVIMTYVIQQQICCIFLLKFV